MLTRYRGRGRPSTKDPSRQIQQEQFSLQFVRHDLAIEQARKLAGWRIYIYVTNAPALRAEFT